MWEVMMIYQKKYYLLIIMIIQVSVLSVFFYKKDYGVLNFLVLASMVGNILYLSHRNSQG